MAFECDINYVRPVPEARSHIIKPEIVCRSTVHQENKEIGVVSDEVTVEFSGVVRGGLQSNLVDRQV